jgi:hypothetical protein
MKRLLTIAAVLACIVRPLAAQDESAIELTRKQIQSDRQTLISAGMELTDEQAGKFWPVYSEYRAELKPIQDRHVELILGYADMFGSVTDEYATTMLKEFMGIRDVARFYQLENKLDAIIAYDLAMSIPVLQ